MRNWKRITGWAVFLCGVVAFAINFAVVPNWSFLQPLSIVVTVAYVLLWVCCIVTVRNDSRTLGWLLILKLLPFALLLLVLVTGADLEGHWLLEGVLLYGLLLEMLYQGFRCPAWPAAIQEAALLGAWGVQAALCLAFFLRQKFFSKL